MLLWHYTPIDVYNQTLVSNKPYICDISKSEITKLDTIIFKNAYDWITSKMNETIQNPDSIQYPVWAWHTFDDKHEKPDLNDPYFKDRKTPMLLVELDIPNTQVLLSDEEKWCFSCLNDMPCFETDEEFDKYENELNDTEKNRLKKESWNKVLDVENSKYIQACFWQLKPEYVKAICFNIKDSKYLKHQSWQLKPEYIK